MLDTSSTQSINLPIGSHNVVDEQPIPLDQIQPLSYAARETKPVDYENLYESIKEEGLQRPFVVARPPDSKHYILIAGGNTRLQIVQSLHRESRGKRFREVHCVVLSWPGFCAAKISHLITNDVLHRASFFERAKAVVNFIDGNADLPIDRATSARRVSKFFSDHGYPLYRTTYTTMRYAIDFLNQHLPLSLASSFSTLDVKHIQKLESTLKQDWVEAGKKESEFNQMFAEVAKSCDHEDLDYETFHDVLTEQVIKDLQDSGELAGYGRKQNSSKEHNLRVGQGSPSFENTEDSDLTTDTVLTKDETGLSNELLSAHGIQEPCEQIRRLAFELAHQFEFQDCIAYGEQGEFGFLVTDLPTEEASLETRLVWEYLVNFSGTCELSKEELMPCLASESKLYHEFQEHEFSPSLQTAKELDLSVMWTLRHESFELLLRLWQLVFEHTKFRPEPKDRSTSESETTANIAT